MESGPDIRAAQDRFVATWGQMASAWGISRTMAEVHALLYITGADLCTDDIMERLQISRGNASMSIRNLLDWGIIERAHRRGDRKDYFRAEGDVWAMFRVIVRERLKREVDPLLASLHEIRDDLSPRGGRARSSDARRAGEDKSLAEHAARVDALVDFFVTVEKLSRSFVSPAGRGLQAAAWLLRRSLPDDPTPPGQPPARTKERRSA
jgi:DNA-binding transcriptional regulator GbsR (MarR family)